MHHLQAMNSHHVLFIPSLSAPPLHKAAAHSVSPPPPLSTTTCSTPSPRPSRRDFLSLALVYASTQAFSKPAFAAPSEAVSPFQLPDLPYAYEALQPEISSQIMRAHHDAHFAAYVNNLNKALSALGKRANDVTTDAQLRQLLARLEDVPSDLRTKVRNSGGGYLNHKQFFSQLTPRGAALGSETRLMADIRAEFGAFEAFERRFLTEAKALFGSGFVWLVKDAKSGRLRLSKYVNQDNPAMDGVGNVALLGCDCWEHAWYYQYGPKKADYIDAWWRVVDWNSVSALYDAATV